MTLPRSLSASASDGVFTMEAVDETAGTRVSPEALEFLHVGAMALLCFMALGVGFERWGVLGWAVAGGLGLLCAAALLFGRYFRHSIADVYRQFQYREKFLLFLVHVAVVAVPMFALGVRDGATLLSLLMLFACLQTIDAVFCARLYAVCAAMAVFACIFHRAAPSPGVVAAWMFSALAAMRFGHIRFRAEQYGGPGGIAAETLLRHAVLPPLAPVAFGFALHQLSSALLRRREWKIDPKWIEGTGPDPGAPVAHVVWNGLWIAAIVVATLVMLHYLDQKLRSRRGAAALADGAVPSTIRTGTVSPVDDAKLAIDRGAGARERILSAFATFAEALARAGAPREARETAAEYLARIDALARRDGALSAEHGAFDTACYDSADIPDARADDFIAALESGLEGVGKG